MSPSSSHRPLAYAFAACAVIILLLLLAHPGGGGHTVQEIIEFEARTARAAGIVHGGFIGVSVILIACLGALARILGATGRAVTLGFVAFCVGAAALMMSMTLDGLVIPALAARCLHEHSAECLASARTLFLFSGSCIGVLMPMGLLFQGAAMLCYSIAIAGAGSKALGGYGIAAGILLVVAPLLIPGTHPHLLLGGIVLLCAWYLALAVYLWSDGAAGARR